MPLDPRTPRDFFGAAVSESAESVGAPLSPASLAYLAELLAGRVRAAGGRAAEPSLAESLLGARLERGSARLQRMRQLGDRALFVSGFFGDSLARSLVDQDYYAWIGRAAYAELADSLSSAVFEELARRWGASVDVLAEVADRSRARRPRDLLRLYERYLRTGSQRDRTLLARLGHAPPARIGRWEPRQ